MGHHRNYFVFFLGKDQKGVDGTEQKYDNTCMRSNNNNNTKGGTMSKAANFKSVFWATSKGVAQFSNGNKSFGILNAAGTHALTQQGTPIVYPTKKVAAQVAPHAVAMAQSSGRHYPHNWVPVFSTKAAAAASV